jgi:homoserine dehydrogenase
MMTSLRIGLIGLGSVGKGLFDIIQSRPDLHVEIKRICVKDLTKHRDVPASLITGDVSELINNSEIDAIVELIDDADAAFAIASAAMRQGKAVVSANKRMVATRLHELIALQQETQQSLLYEASTCASIPIIRNLEEYYTNGLLTSVTGIVNGTTNYILTRLTSAAGSNFGYIDALGEAQEKGFAESDPTLDVEGFDAVFKSTILAKHAFGALIDPSTVIRRGIAQVNSFDITFAASQGFVIKHLAHIEERNSNELSVYAMPTFVLNSNPISWVSYEINAVRLATVAPDAQLLAGRGAGGISTACAVLSDLSMLRHNYRYTYRKGLGGKGPTLSNDVTVRAYVRGNEAMINSVRWIQRQIDVRSIEANFVIGSVNLQALADSPAFRDTDTFVGMWSSE